MSLRLRLTLLYTSIVTGILLIFGASVYFLISLLLFDHIDSQLAGIVSKIQIDVFHNERRIVLPQLDQASTFYIQVWGRDEQLIITSQNIGWITEPLDPSSLDITEAVYRESYLLNSHLRVLTVPIIISNRVSGVVQVATNLDLVDTVRDNMFMILVGAALIAAVMAAFGSWYAVGSSLTPLDAVTETAEQINRADDLSRRIPYEGPQTDEIGSLIGAFNQTLERLETLFTSQQRFLADVSHELRTPLTVIKGNVDLMRKMKIYDEESLTSINQEAGRLTRLVEGLLLLAKAESGKLPLTFTLFELDTLLLEVFREMNVLASGKVKIHLTEIDQVQINGDRDRLKQVLLNLIANAIQYTPQGGEIFISLGIVSDQARLIIRDTGPGIPDDDLPHIFERFYRAEKARTRSQTTGFGLGLSIAYWIVDKHSGRIEVDSKEGEGTTFCIWLPVSSTQPSTIITQTN